MPRSDQGQAADQGLPEPLECRAVLPDQWLPEALGDPERLVGLPVRDDLGRLVGRVVRASLDDQGVRVDLSIRADPVGQRVRELLHGRSGKRDLSFLSLPEDREFPEP